MSTAAYLAEIDAHCASIHAANVSAGWWSDRHTGESILTTRNRGEIMMLIVSEVIEAADGHEHGIMDDHLPHLPMFWVELADTAIRLMDLLGADKDLFEVGDVVDYGVVRSTAAWDSEEGLSIDGHLLRIIRRVALAMEGHRKGQLLTYVSNLSGALLGVFATAQVFGIDLPDVIAQKRAYNRQRADHKLENRQKPGGKAY